jgi:hypothetical protein
MDNFTDTEDEFEKRLFLLDEFEIIKLNKIAQSGELNNVVTARRAMCYGLLIKENSFLNVSWQLFFVNGKKVLEGALLELDLKGGDNAKLVMMFSKFLTQKYDEIDLLDTYNTFQDHTRTMLEMIGFWTVSTEELEEIGDPNPVIVKKNVRGIIPIRTIKKERFYKDFFGTELISRSHEPQVYLLLNPELNHVKIGRSKKPGFRERTLQSQEPEIYLIAKWVAPATVETFFHRRYGDKRVRGEWFKLNFRELNEIKEYMISKIWP